ncbi:MAG: hypothetical protein JWQ10_3251 [Herbaspirillum sp.]|jgi:hypothetical protein|nr:hypothetical protein [Herbaspirillum sp.]
MRNQFLLATVSALLFSPLLALLFALPVDALAADQKPRDLAMESYRFMDAAQGKLGAWIKNANKADYFAQFSSPAKTIAAKWPQPLKEEYYEYADCYFALDLLIKYADQAVADKSSSSPAELARRARFGKILQECQRDLGKIR